LLPFSDAQRLFSDILESIDQIDRFIANMDFAAYKQDEKTKAAVERKMQILTEAVIRLEQTEGRGAHPEIDWSAYRGMGNFLRHSYHRVSDEIVWNTLKDDLPVLRQMLRRSSGGRLQPQTNQQIEVK
jgi:uncharacterized protein with HEPN domain